MRTMINTLIAALLMTAAIPASVGFADPVDRGMRLTIDTTLYEYRRIDIEDTFLNTLTLKEKSFGLFARSLGLTVGLVRGGSFFSGLRVRLSHLTADDTSKRIDWSVEPLLEGMIDTAGSVRPFAQLGVVIRGRHVTDSLGDTIVIPGYGFSFSTGIYGFATDSLSIDTRFYVQWTRGTADPSLEEVTDMRVGLVLGLSGWVRRGQDG